MINRLVLLPGLDGTGELFSDFVAALPQTIETTVVRYPTQESRTYAELLGVVRNLVAPLEKFVLVGESFSSPLAIQLAGSRPPNLAGLVICVGFVSNPFPRSRRLVRALAKPSLFGLPTPEFILKHYLTGWSGALALRRKIRQNRLLVRPKVLADRVQEILKSDAKEELMRINVPILYLQGAYDRLIGKRCFEEIRRLQPRSILASIPAHHVLLQQKPVEAAEAVMKFMRACQDEQAIAPA
jgi:pimeloyl-[acyl-carrier protein] methyl ester esterase